MRAAIRLELTGADTARSLRFLNEQGISVSRPVQKGELTVQFSASPSDSAKIAALCEKRGDKLVLLQKQGLPFALKGFLRRPVLILGLLLFLSLGWFLPSRVLFIRVEGNDCIPSRRILETAESCGVGFGASRKYVRSEKVKNALLGAIPELQWAGVNTAGCTAVISVREKQAVQSAQAPQRELTADRDGYVVSVQVTKGTGLVRPGEVVRKGQTLISGYADPGLCIRATGAEGEVFAETKRDFQAVTPANCLVRTGESRVKRKYSLLFQKKRINLWKDSGICDATCGRMYEEYFITLPGGYQLPFALCVETYMTSDLRLMELDPLGAEEGLKQFAHGYLREQMVSGRILNAEERVFQEDGRFRLEGTYDCTEMIGRVRKIGDTNGKRD